MVNYAGLNPIFAARISAAIQAAEQATGGKAVVTSAYRTYADQARAWNNYQSGKGGIAARPGKSLHEQGMAFDLGPGPVRDWIEGHAAQYGLEAATASDRKRGTWGQDAPHIQLARSTLKTPYDSTPNAFAEGGRALPGVPVDPFGVMMGKASGALPSSGASSSRDQVRAAQTTLASMGLYKGPIDGIVGKQTRAAVRSAENSFGLTRDKGVIGPQVQAALANQGAVNDIGSLPAPGGTPAVAPMTAADFAFGRSPAASGGDGSFPGRPSYPAPNGSAPIATAPHSLGPYITGAPGRTGIPAPGPYEMAGSGGMTSGGPPSSMPTTPFELNPQFTAGGGVPGASATMAMAPYSPPSPDPNQFGPDMAFLSRLAQPMDETLPGTVPASGPLPRQRPAGSPSPSGSRFADAFGPGYTGIRGSPEGRRGPAPVIPAVTVSAPGGFVQPAHPNSAPESQWDNFAHFGEGLGSAIASAPGAAWDAAGNAGAAVFGPGGPVQSAGGFLRRQLGMDAGSDPTVAALGSPSIAPAVPPGGGYSGPSSPGRVGAGLSSPAVPPDSFSFDQSWPSLQGSAGGDAIASAGKPRAPWGSFGSHDGEVVGTMPNLAGNPALSFGPALPAPPRPVTSKPGGISKMVQDGLNALGIDFGKSASGGAGTGGSIVPSQSYGGSPGSYSFAGTTPWGSATYRTPSGGFSNSPFTPSGAGWSAPNFNPVSGGPTYAYNKNDRTFVNSFGQTMSY